MMTTFGTPSEPPPYPPGDVPGQFHPLVGRPWSLAAIAGFVISLCGCMVITAVAGLILGIVGIIRTAGGQRRGMAFAVASIPISLILGGFGTLVAIGLYFMGQVLQDAQDRLPALLASEDFPTEFRAVASDALNERLTDERLGSWISKVRSEHGKLAGIEYQGIDSESGPGTQQLDLRLRGKFLNGDDEVIVSLLIPEASSGNLKIANLSVGGEWLVPPDAGREPPAWQEGSGPREVPDAPERPASPEPEDPSP